MPTVVVAFWACAGFENMTFIAGEFKNPQRDVLISIFVSLVACGLLYIGLTANFIKGVPEDDIDQIAGLYQLAKLSSYSFIATPLVTLFAITAVFINFMSWVWGISRLIYASSQRGILPQYFDQISTKQVPTRALILLGLIFSAVICVSVVFPNSLEKILVVVSTNFTVLYFLTVAAYFTQATSLTKKVFAVTVLAVLSAAIYSSGWAVLYAIFLVLCGTAFSIYRLPTPDN